MTRYTVFVPEYVDQSGFDKASWNDRFDFVDVDSASFDPEAENIPFSRFVILGCDHLACYNNTICIQFNYIPGNHIQSEVFHMLNLVYSLFFKSSYFDNQSADLENRRSPLVCFMEKGYYEVNPSLSRGFFGLSLYPYSRDSQSIIDIGGLANIVKEWNKYKFDMFLVKDRNKIQVHSLETPIFHTLVEQERMIFMLQAGTCTIHDLTKIDGRVPLKQQSPDFKLCDSTGVPVAEGEEFWFQYFDDYALDTEESHDVEATSFERKYYNTECIRASGSVYGGLGDPDILKHEVIDGITYLKARDQYLYADDSNGISLSDSIPQKEQRLQIEYNHRGDVMLSKWGGSVFAECDYVKASFGIIRFREIDISAHLFWPMVLRLHRR